MRIFLLLFLCISQGFSGPTEEGRIQRHRRVSQDMAVFEDSFVERWEHDFQSKSSRIIKNVMERIHGTKRYKLTVEELQETRYPHKIKLTGSMEYKNDQKIACPIGESFVWLEDLFSHQLSKGAYQANNKIVIGKFQDGGIRTPCEIIYPVTGEESDGDHRSFSIVRPTQLWNGKIVDSIPYERSYSFPSSLTNENLKITGSNVAILTTSLYKIPKLEGKEQAWGMCYDDMQIKYDLPAQPLSSDDWLEFKLKHQGFVFFHNQIEISLENLKKIDTACIPEVRAQQIVSILATDSDKILCPRIPITKFYGLVVAPPLETGFSRNYRINVEGTIFDHVVNPHEISTFVFPKKKYFWGVW